MIVHDFTIGRMGLGSPCGFHLCWAVVPSDPCGLKACITKFCFQNYSQAAERSGVVDIIMRAPLRQERAL